MKRLKIENGTHWPDPTDEAYHDIAWRMIHHPESVTAADMMCVVSVFEAYDNLILHPAFTLKEVGKIVSGIRKAIKERAK